MSRYGVSRSGCPVTLKVGWRLADERPRRVLRAQQGWTALNYTYEESPPVAVYRATIFATALGQRINNTLHVVSTGTPADLGADLSAAWTTHMLPSLSDRYVFEGVELVNVETDDAGTFAPATGVATGGIGGACTTTWVCASHRLITGRRGRAGQGKFGLGPLAETITDDNVIIPTALASLQARATAFLTDINSSGVDGAGVLAVVSYRLNGQDRPAPLVSLVDRIVVNQTLGSRLSRHPNR